jgi:hypothetical protein
MRIATPGLKAQHFHIVGTTGVPMEHRCGTRSPLRIAVRLSTRSGCGAVGRIENASVSGAFIRTRADLPAFTHVLVEIQSEGAESEPVEAYVVRTTPTGVGLEWCEFAPPAIAAAFATATVGRSKGMLLHSTARGDPRIPAGG